MQMTLIYLHIKLSDIQVICFHITLPLSQKRLAEPLHFGIFSFQNQLVKGNCKTPFYFLINRFSHFPDKKATNSHIFRTKTNYASHIFHNRGKTAQLICHLS